MRIVLDTNVSVSAFLKLNSLPFLAVRWIDQHGGLPMAAGNVRVKCDGLSPLAEPPFLQQLQTP